jgi:hypothetical protein
MVRSVVFFVFLLLCIGLMLLHVEGPLFNRFLRPQIMLLLLFVFILDPAVKKYRVEIADRPEQEPLQQVQQLHEQS